MSWCSSTPVCSNQPGQWGRELEREHHRDPGREPRQSLQSSACLLPVDRTHQSTNPNPGSMFPAIEMRIGRRTASWPPLEEPPVHAGGLFHYSSEPAGRLQQGHQMRGVAVLPAACLLLVSCSPEPEVKDSINACVAKLYSAYNPKALDECVDVCIKCERGTTTTCSTSCTLKGAR